MLWIVSDGKRRGGGPVDLGRLLDATFLRQQHTSSLPTSCLSSCRAHQPSREIAAVTKVAVAISHTMILFFRRGPYVEAEDIPVSLEGNQANATPYKASHRSPPRISFQSMLQKALIEGVAMKSCGLTCPNFNPRGDCKKAKVKRTSDQLQRLWEGPRGSETNSFMAITFACTSLGARRCQCDNSVAHRSRTWLVGSSRTSAASQ